MVGTAWIDRPVDTQGLRSRFHVLLSAAWKRHALADTVTCLRGETLEV